MDDFLKKIHHEVTDKLGRELKEKELSFLRWMNKRYIEQQNGKQAG